jgi:RNA polymerase sigma-70 factor (ECF subfamily)
MPEPRPAAAFPTTHWSRIVRAGDPRTPEARAALTELCAAYWYPIYAFIRRRGHASDKALDLTQDYFARLLEADVLSAADQAKGRFRAFLRTDCGYFLSDHRDKERALKRGGGRAALSIDARDAEGRYLLEPADNLTPEKLFDRAWALALLDGVLLQLGQEYADSGRTPLFEQLKVVLTEGARSVPYAIMAERLGTTEVAIEAAARRLRARYREVLRAQISATLDDPADLDDEIRDLFAALQR